MTETTSTRNDRTPQASFFKQYLRYSVEKNKTYLLISTVLAVVAIPLFVIITAVFYVHLYSVLNSAEEYNDSLGMILYFLILFVGASFFGLYILALTGGTRCFEVLTRRHKTDTLMCLPLNHSQRFWGDFLTGYITGVAPIIPAGIVGILIGAIMQGLHPTQHFVKLAFLYALTIFFTMTFAYTLSVLAAALCGKISGSIVTSAVLVIISIGLVECWGRFFLQSIAGLPVNQYLKSLQIEPVPSITFIPGLLAMFSHMDLADTNGINVFLKSPYAVQNPLNVILYILLPAGFTVLAYYITKHRKPEHNGEIFAAKHGAAAVTILLIVTATGGICCLFTPDFNWIAASILSLVASVIICVAVELILRQGVKKLGRRVIAYAIATCAAIGVSILLYGTHALGYSYYVPQADKIVSVKYNGEGKLFIFNKESDIKKFRDNHEQFLRTYMGNLGTRYIAWDEYENLDSYTLEYTLDNGKTYRRCYKTKPKALHNDAADYLRMEKARDALNSLHTTLEDYVPQYTALLTDHKNEEVVVRLGGTFGSYEIDNDKLSEFTEILKQDIENHYDPEAMPIGYAGVSDGWLEREYYILDTYTNTIAFAKNPENAVFYNGNYPDDEPITKYFISYSRRDIDIDLAIRESDNSPAVKELESLIKTVNRYDTEKAYSEEVKRALTLVSPDEVFNYYIPENDIPQAVKLILQIASERT